PSTRTCPAVGASNPAIRFSKVDLPQPLAPTSVTISRSATDRLISSSAVMAESPASKRLVTDTRLILPTERFPLIPGEQNVSNENDDPVAQEAQQSDAEHRGNHDIVAIEQVRIVQEVTEATAHREDLRDHDEHPGDAHGQSDASQDRR